MLAHEAFTRAARVDDLVPIKTSRPCSLDRLTLATTSAMDPTYITS